jgi:hypothetical protein
MFERKKTLSAMPYFQDEFLEIEGNNYCVRKKMFEDKEFRFIDSHFIYNYFDDALFAKFVKSCEIRNIDAVFLRLPPFCKVDYVPPSRIITSKYKKDNTCFIDTTVDYFSDMSKSYRNLIRRAKQEFLIDTLKPSAHDLFTFAHDYNKYMKEKSTEHLYYLDPVKFQILGSSPDLLRVQIKTKNHQIIVSSLFIKNKDFLYYWFSYSIGKVPQGAGQLSIFAACEYASKAKILGVFLGGGMTDKDDDSLWKFKKYFSSSRLNVNYIGISVSNAFQSLGRGTDDRMLPW